MNPTAARIADTWHATADQIGATVDDALAAQLPALLQAACEESDEATVAAADIALLAGEDNDTARPLLAVMAAWLSDHPDGPAVMDRLRAALAADGQLLAAVVGAWWDALGTWGEHLDGKPVEDFLAPALSLATALAAARPLGVPVLDAGSSFRVSAEELIGALLCAHAGTPELGISGERVHAWTADAGIAAAVQFGQRLGVVGA